MASPSFFYFLDLSTRVKILYISNSKATMKKLLLKFIIFSAPFIFLALIIIKVDPYNYFSDNSQNNDAKQKIARKINYALWKIVEYKRHPLPNILLGDSQMGRLKRSDILEIADKEFYNFSYGGATLPEMINTFWFAAETVKLKNAYFGISFNHFNISFSGDLTEPRHRGTRGERRTSGRRDRSFR